MEQTGRDQIQKNASDLEDSAQDMPPKVDCEAVGDGSNGDTKSGVNNADNKTAVSTQKSVRWSEQLVLESTYVASDNSDTTSYTSGSNPCVSHSSSPSPSTSLKERIGGARNVLGRWGSNVREATKKAVDLAGNTWQHCIAVLIIIFFFPDEFYIHYIIIYHIVLIWIQGLVISQSYFDTWSIRNCLRMSWI